MFISNVHLECSPSFSLKNDSKNWLDLITPVKLSDKLAKFVGVQAASHVECIHKIWAHLERRNLLQFWKVRNVAKRYGVSLET